MADTLTIQVPEGMSREQALVLAEQAAAAHRAKQGRLAAFAKFTMPRYKTPPHILATARYLEEIESGENDRLIVLEPPRHGKLITDETPVITPRGWRKHGELQSGDEVYAPSGEAVRVIAATGSYRWPVQRLSFSDGSEIVASREHEWLIQRDRDCRCRTPRGHRHQERVETQGMLSGYHRRAPAIPVAAAVEGRPQLLPIEPYLLGLWLGDGRVDDSEISVGEQDLPFVAKLGKIKRYGRGITVRPPGLKLQLKAAGLIRDKHVPSPYFAAPISDRLALLQGLMDSDGYISAAGQCEFTNTNKRLAHDTRLLIQTLGMKASWGEGRATLRGRDCGPKYRVGFYPCGEMVPFRLERKWRRMKDGCRRLTTVGNRYIRSVKDAGQRLGQCIQVEGGQYLVGETLVPTSNSELVSVRFPAHYMVRHPSRSFITASYGEVLATVFGRKARNVATLPRVKSLYPGVELSADSKAANLWTTTHGGTFLSVGIGGAITGFGADHLNIDDPIRKREEAESAVKRESTWQWFQAEAYTRLEPKGTISLTMTPWHHDDLAARLVALSEYGGDKWKIIRFPAIAEDHDELGRKPGDALWPERFPVAELERIRANIGEYEWNALYQLRPAPPEGNIFKWWPRYTKLPDVIDEVLVVIDTAYTAKQRSDYTAVAAWARSGKFLYLVGALRWKKEAPEAERHVAFFFESVRKRFSAVPVRLLHKERVAIDRIAGQHLRAKNIPVIGVRLPGGVDNEALARIVSVEFEADKAMIPTQAAWLPPWQQEHIDYPNGVHDDWVETTIVALWYAFRAAPFVRPEEPISIFERSY